MTDAVPDTRKGPSNVADSASETANTVAEPYTSLAENRIDCRHASPFARPVHSISGPARALGSNGSHVSGGRGYVLRGDTQIQVTTPVL